jgi:hypothetical protein
MGLNLDNWTISKQRELSEFGKSITDIISFGEVRSKKHAAVLEQLFLSEQINRFRSNLPNYARLLNKWKEQLDTERNNPLFFLLGDGTKFSVVNHIQSSWNTESVIQKKIGILSQLIDLLSYPDEDESRRLLQSLREKEEQLLPFTTEEDNLALSGFYCIFIPFNKTYTELLQIYIRDNGLKYLQIQYTRLHKVLYVKTIRDLRGALREKIHFLFKNMDDEDADKEGSRTEGRIYFKNHFIKSSWISKQLSQILRRSFIPQIYRPKTGMLWSRPAS